MTKLIYLICFTLLSLGCNEPKDEIEERKNPPIPKPEDFSPEIAHGIEEVGSPIRSSHLEELKKKVGTNLSNKQGFHGQGVTIAILDNGFVGLDKAKGVTVPPDVSIEPIHSGEMGKSIHGTKLLEIAYAVATGSPKYDPKLPSPDFKLFVTSGAYDNLNSSVARLVEMKNSNPSKPLIVLYAQNWEWGGNLNEGGYTGFIDYLAKYATDAGIIWVNSAGNAGQATYIDTVSLDEKGNLKLPVDGKYLEFEVTQRTTVKMTLGWNDFRNNFYTYRTPYDLDLILEDAEGNIKGESTKIQDGQDHGDDKSYSRHAREMLKGTLNPGTYRIRASARTDFYEGAKFWFVASGQGVFLKQKSQENTVFMPAHLESVVAVGASDVDFGGFSIEDGVTTKPDIFCPSQMFFDSARPIQGTSTATAVCVGALAAYASAQDGILFRNSVEALAYEDSKGRMRLNLSK